MTERIDFDSTETFDIAGRGRVYVGPYPFAEDMATVIGRVVHVADRPMVVRGVEWNLCRRPRLGDVVGMLLGDMTQEPSAAHALAAAIHELIIAPAQEAMANGQSAGGSVVLPNGSIYRWGVLAGPVINTNRVPSKASGRRGTRKAWKRKHPPGWFF